MKIGVAMSGGGHRASAWGVGVLAALVDAGLGTSIVSVSSVSGGSITNGVIAQNLDLRTATSEQFDDAIGPALESYATTGLFPHGPLTRRYLRAVIAAAIVAAFSFAAVVVLLVVAAFADGWEIVGAAGAVAAVMVISIIALLVLVARRGSVVRSAIARTHFHGTRHSLGTPLATAARPVNHVLLTTDLEAGDQFYLAPKFLYGYREGIADPSVVGTALAEAVQASAALPGAFPPVRLRTGEFTRPWPTDEDEAAEFEPRTSPTEVWLADGGVYDNMAEQWESGIKGRRARWKELDDIQSPAELLIVANASAGWGWKPYGSGRWPKREITGLFRDQGVQYDVSTARRRRALVQTWIRNEQQGSGQRGVIVMIDRSPFELAEDFAKGTDDRATRANEAIRYLGDKKKWEKIAHDNAEIETTLDALNIQRTVDLIEQAYVSTLVGLYVVHGLGELLPFDRSRFERRCATS